MEQKFVFISTYFNEANWHGQFNSSILLKLEFNKLKKRTGLLSDTLYSDRSIFCDVVDKKYELKKEFKDTQMLNSKNNGSFSDYMNYSPQILIKIKKALKSSGYIIIDETKETLSTAIQNMKKYVPNDYDKLMVALFK